MCKNTTPHQRSVGSCIFIAKIIKNRTIDEVISKSQGLNGVYPKIDLPPLSLSGFSTSAFAKQSASFALATTHSQDVLLNASRPYRRSPLKGNPRRPLRVGTHSALA